METLNYALGALELQFSGLDIVLAQSDLYILGEIIGYYNPITEEKITKQDLIEKICQCGLSDIESLLAYSLGSFFVLRKQNDIVEIVTAAGFLPGLFYIKENKKIIFSIFENDIYRNSGKLTLNEEFVFSDYCGDPIPLFSGKTFFKEVNRILAGTKTLIYSTGEINTSLYSLEKYQQLEEHSFDDQRYREKLNHAILVTVSLLMSEYKDRQVYLLMSDGIDSMSVFFALLETGQKFSVINITDYTPLIGMIDFIKAYVKNNGQVTFIDLNLRDHNKYLQDPLQKVPCHFRLQSSSSALNMVADYFQFNNILSPILFMGNGFDIAYHGRKTGSSIEIGTSWYYAHVKYLFKRFYRSYKYLDLLARRRCVSVLSRVKNPVIPYTPEDYVASFLAGPDGLDDGFYPFTMFQKKDNYSDLEFKKLYYDVRKKESVDILLPYIKKFYPTWTAEGINFFCRFSLAYEYFGSPRILYDSRNFCDYKFIDPMHYPSMFTLFLKCKIDSYYDLFKIKRAIFAFVNLFFARHGTTYEVVAKKCRRSNCGLEYDFKRICMKNINIKFRYFVKKLLPNMVVRCLQKDKIIPAKSNDQDFDLI